MLTKSPSSNQSFRWRLRPSRFRRSKSSTSCRGTKDDSSEVRHASWRQVGASREGIHGSSKRTKRMAHNSKSQRGSASCRMSAHLLRGCSPACVCGHLCRACLRAFCMCLTMALNSMHMPRSPASCCASLQTQRRRPTRHETV